jgi:hypothetical protein
MMHVMEDPRRGSSDAPPLMLSMRTVNVRISWRMPAGCIIDLAVNSAELNRMFTSGILQAVQSLGGSPRILVARFLNIPWIE